MWEYGSIKTTVEIPDPLFRKAKSKAAERSRSLKEFMTEALQEKLVRTGGDVRAGEPRGCRGSASCVVCARRRLASRIASTRHSR